MTKYVITTKNNRDVAKHFPIAKKEILQFESPRNKRGVYYIEFNTPQIINPLFKGEIIIDKIFVYDTGIGIIYYTHDRLGEIYFAQPNNGWQICPHKAPKQVRRSRDKDRGIDPQSLGYSIEAYAEDGVVNPPLNFHILKEYESQIDWLIRRRVNQGICLPASGSTLPVLQDICLAEAWKNK